MVDKIKLELAKVKSEIIALASNNGLNIIKVFESRFSSNKSNDIAQTYKESNHLFTELKKFLSLKFPNQLLGEKVQQARVSNTDRPLNDDEKFLRKNMDIAIERYFLIIKVLYKINTTNLRLKRFSPNFDTYNYANFYRTICENTPKLLADPAYLMVNFVIDKYKSNNNNNQEIENKTKELESLKKKVLSPDFSLSQLLTIICKFEKESSYKGLAKKFKEIFLYKDNEGGFSLRNDVAHDKKLLTDMNRDILIAELNKINTFNTAFIFTFYIDYLQGLIARQDLRQALIMLASIK